MSMRRAAALRAVRDDLEGAAVITIMGAVAVELHALGHRPNFFYLEHAMGLASSMGLGVALAQPERPVVVFDGDGSVLMNLGGLTTLARYKPANLVHVIFDNESLLSVGGFPTATGTGADLAAIARGAGSTRVKTPASIVDFADSLREALRAREFTTIVVKVEEEGPASFDLGISLLENRYQFMRWLEGSGAG